MFKETTWPQINY